MEAQGAALERPPNEWLVRHGYGARYGPTVPPRALAAYAYEQVMGKPPPDRYEPGSAAWRQYAYQGQGDPREVAA